MICAQTRFPGVSVSQVARRYDVNANQVFNWLKDPKFAVESEGADMGRFLPVEVVEPTAPEVPTSDVSGALQIELAGGHRVTVTGPYDAVTLAALLRNLST